MGKIINLGPWLDSFVFTIWSVVAYGHFRIAGLDILSSAIFTITPIAIYILKEERIDILNGKHRKRSEITS